MAVELEKEGYKVCHINFENYKNASIEAFLGTFISEINHSWKTEYPVSEMAVLFQNIRKTPDQKFVPILVGVSNSTGIMQDNASPFNIADELNVPYFTNDETDELLGQHTTETGQVFEKEVVVKISEITANQPGLVDSYMTQTGEIHFDKLIESYRNHIALRSFRPFREKDENEKYISIPEVAMIYSFETFITIFVQEIEGKLYRESIILPWAIRI